MENMYTNLQVYIPYQLDFVFYEKKKKKTGSYLTFNILQIMFLLKQIYCCSGKSLCHFTVILYVYKTRLLPLKGKHQIRSKWSRS